MATGPGLELMIALKRFAPEAPPLFADFELVVEPATVLAVLGPSGIGKSTLLRLVAGVDADYVGHIRVDGRPAATAPPPGFVFQEPRLLPWFTALGNLRAVAPGLDVAAARAALADVGLGEAAGSFPHQLSGGMQRRVALARALSVNPGLLLLDEPFVSLDRDLVREMQDLLAAVLTKCGATALLVTHVPDDAARLAHRAIVLGGRPARIIADISFDRPPANRSASDIASYAARLSAPR